MTRRSTVSRVTAINDSKLVMTKVGKYKLARGSLIHTGNNWARPGLRGHSPLTGQTIQRPAEALSPPHGSAAGNFMNKVWLENACPFLDPWCIDLAQDPKSRSSCQTYLTHYSRWLIGRRREGCFKRRRTVDYFWINWSNIVTFLQFYFNFTRSIYVQEECIYHIALNWLVPGTGLRL